MSAWKQHLPDEKITEIRNGLINAGLATDAILEAIMNTVDRQFAASLPGAGTPASIRLLTQLHSMNKVANLRNGEIPLQKWLTNARDVASPHNVGQVIEDALAMMSDQEAAAAEIMAAADAAADAAAAGAFADLNTNIAPEAMVGGSDQTLTIAYLRRGIEAARSVFKVLVHRHQDGNPEFASGDTPRLVNGTGWMIGPRLMITNHHVINARTKSFFTEPDASEQDFRIQAEHTQVLYDYHEDDQPSHTLTTGAGALMAADKKLDFAILRLPNDAPERPPLKLRSHVIIKKPSQALGTRVNVLQHPSGKPMRIGFRDNFVTIGDKNRLAYLTDTATGSSGSPVCDDAWTVAALHAGSRSVSDENIEIRGRKIKYENVGMPIPTIMAKLKADHLALHDEILAAQA